MFTLVFLYLTTNNLINVTGAEPLVIIFLIFFMFLDYNLIDALCYKLRSSKGDSKES